MANCTGLYTEDEIIAEIKALQQKLNSGVTKSDLDTSQSRGSFSLSIRQLERQLETWMGYLKQVNPCMYHAMKGPSVIQFKGSRC